MDSPEFRRSFLPGSVSVGGLLCCLHQLWSTLIYQHHLYIPAARGTDLISYAQRSLRIVVLRSNARSNFDISFHWKPSGWFCVDRARSCLPVKPSFNRESEENAHRVSQRVRNTEREDICQFETLIGCHRNKFHHVATPPPHYPPPLCSCQMAANI